MALALLAVAISGCISDQALDNTAADSGALLDKLWRGHQNEAHADFGYPTLFSTDEGVPEWWLPIQARHLPLEVSGLEHVTVTEGIESGAGIAVFGRLAIVPGYGPNTTIVDISDPGDPVVLSDFEPQHSPRGADELAPNTHRGADIIAYPDGRLVTVISTSRIIDVWDITDPTDPQPLPYLEPGTGSHKVGVVPGTPIVYNGASDGGAGRDNPTGQISPAAGDGITEIFDLTDPENPVHVKDWENGYSCHRIFFWNDADQGKHRAICAGIEYTQIWDTADPRDPQVIVSVPVHHGVADGPSTAASVVQFSHYANLNDDGTILIVGDEMGGGGLPPGCVGEVRTVAGSVSTPIGAVWFYDVTDETNPVLQGYYSPLNDPTVKDPRRSCTAHHGQIVPQEGRDLLAMSFYGDGVILIDFTDPTLPIAVDQYVDGSNTWETVYYNGYLFTGDLERGMDVLTFS